MNLSTESLLSLNECEARAIFENATYPWEVLSRISTFILEYAKTLSSDYTQIDDGIWVGKGTTIEKSALIKGPAIIGHNTEIRHCAYIRGNVIIGDNVIIGNSSEIKNAILFNGVQVPHFNYVSDSVLGYKAHLGAGVITSNLKSNGTPVSVKDGEMIYETGLRKFGAILGDFAEVGCNAVLNPGSIIGQNSIVYPLSSVRGCVPSNMILKSSGELIQRV